MRSLSYRGHRFPACIIQHAIWLYLRFTLSYRDVEELLAERGLDLSYETIRRWVLKFGPAIARGLRQRRPRPGDLKSQSQLLSLVIEDAVELFQFDSVPLNKNCPVHVPLDFVAKASIAVGVDGLLLGRRPARL
jgi:hypothetical protein